MSPLALVPDRLVENAARSAALECGEEVDFAQHGKNTLLVVISALARERVRELRAQRRARRGGEEVWPRGDEETVITRRHCNGAALRGPKPSKDAEERRFARAVRTDNEEPPFRAQRKAQIAHQQRRDRNRLRRTRTARQRDAKPVARQRGALGERAPPTLACRRRLALVACAVHDVAERGNALGEGARLVERAERFEKLPDAHRDVNHHVEGGEEVLGDVGDAGVAVRGEGAVVDGRDHRGEAEEDGDVARDEAAQHIGAQLRVGAGRDDRVNARKRGGEHLTLRLAAAKEIDLLGVGADRGVLRDEHALRLALVEDEILRRRRGEAHPRNDADHRSVEAPERRDAHARGELAVLHHNIRRARDPLLEGLGARRRQPLHVRRQPRVRVAELAQRRGDVDGEVVIVQLRGEAAAEAEGEALARPRREAFQD